MTNTCVHFVGFRANEYISAIKVWGMPDFIHKTHDGRMYEEISEENDIVVFANGHETKKTPYNWDASKDC